MNILQNLLNHQFCSSVRIGAGQWKFFGDRNCFGITVNCSRGTEDNIFKAEGGHHFTESESSINVIAIIEQRLFHGFAHRLFSGKMNDSIKRGVGLTENLLKCSFIKQIRLVKRNSFPRKLFYSAQRLPAGIGKIVNNSYFITIIEQFKAGMTADISGPSCD